MEDDEQINNDTNLPVKVPKKRTVPKKAKVKKEKEKLDPLHVPMTPGTVKIERGKFIVRW